ncbi:MAG: YihY family inner membrane protein [Syntrophales bacterium]|nr:YihY family inner membrane protein [Syntrophales bacterium]
MLNLAKKLNFFINTHLEFFGRIQNTLAELWDILIDAVENFIDNGDTNQAAAISLYALLSLIPLIILYLIMAAHFFGTQEALQQQILEGMRNVIPQISENLLKSLGDIQQKEKALGWIGIASLLWFSAMIFGSMETALNITFRSHKKRNYLLSKALAVVMIPTVMTIGMISFAITSIILVITQHPVLTNELTPLLPPMQRMIIKYLVPYAIMVTFFTIIYKTVPTVHIPFKVALLGSAIFSLLTETAKHLFTWYVANYTRYSIIFGSLETIVILIIWVFYAGIIFLFCAEFMSSYIRQNTIMLERALIKSRAKGLRINERLLKRFGRIYPRGTYIFHEGDTGNEMYYIISGKVGIEKQAGHVKKLLMVLERGQYFGEMAAFVDTPRTASAVALEDTSLAIFHHDIVKNLLKENEEISMLMLREFSVRLKNTNESLETATKEWIKTLTLLFLTYVPVPTRLDYIVTKITALTGRDGDDIEAILWELHGKGVLTIDNNVITQINKEKGWEVVAERI